MRIISKFKDYYDGAQAYGADPDNVYVRKTTIIEKLGEMPEELRSATNNSWKTENDTTTTWLPILNSEHDLSYVYELKNSRYVSSHIVFFCGKMVPLKRVRKPNAFGDHTFDFFYSEEDYQEYLSCYKRKEENLRKWTRTIRWLKDPRPKLFSEYKKDVINLHIELNTPCFVLSASEHGRGHRNYHPLRITINPCLKDYGFYKYIDAYSTYQELSMFTGGVLTNQEDVEPIPDEYLKEAKGFDDWSFKKMPTKRR